MKRLSVLFAALSLSTAVFAGAADEVVVYEPYIRLAPPNAQATGAFMVLKNTGGKNAKYGNGSQQSTFHTFPQSTPTSLSLRYTGRITDNAYDRTVICRGSSSGAVRLFS